LIGFILKNSMEKGVELVIVDEDGKNDEKYTEVEQGKDKQWGGSPEQEEGIKVFFFFLFFFFFFFNFLFSLSSHRSDVLLKGVGVEACA